MCELTKMKVQQNMILGTVTQPGLEPGDVVIPGWGDQKRGDPFSMF